MSFTWQQSALKKLRRWTAGRRHSGLFRGSFFGGSLDVDPTVDDLVGSGPEFAWNDSLLLETERLEDRPERRGVHLVHPVAPLELVEKRRRLLDQDRQDARETLFELIRLGAGDDAEAGQGPLWPLVIEADDEVDLGAGRDGVEELPAIEDPQQQHHLGVQRQHHVGMQEVNNRVALLLGKAASVEEAA